MIVNLIFIFDKKIIKIKLAIIFLQMIVLFLMLYHLKLISKLINYLIYQYLKSVQVIMLKYLG